MWPGRSSVAGSAPVDSKVTIVDPPAARLEAESRGMCRDLSVKWTTRAVGWWSAMDMPWRRRFPSTRQPRSFKRVEARRPTPMSCGYDRARTAGGDCRRPHVRNETTSCGTDRFLQVDGLAEGSHRTFRAAVSPITPPWAQNSYGGEKGNGSPTAANPRGAGHRRSRGRKSPDVSSGRREHEWVPEDEDLQARSSADSLPAPAPGSTSHHEATR